MDDGHLEINTRLSIPLAELTFRASRSGGPGGQHVNTSSTRIEVVWDVAASPSLDDAQRARLLAQLAPRLDKEGRLRLVSGATRSQLQNRTDVTARLARLVAEALHVPRPRKRTKPSRASKAARLEAKRQRAGLKASRRRVDRDD